MGCEDLPKRIHALAASELPGPVRAAAERMLLNVAACALAGSTDSTVRALSSLAKAHGGKGVAPLVGQGERSDLYWAAYVAGTAARALDFDDVDLATLLHPSAAPFRTLVALAATRETSGRRALTAFALGCEVAIRLARAVSPYHYEAGWDAAGTCGAIGAAVTATILLGADAEQMMNAMGSAAGQICGQRDAFGHGSGLLHTGKAAAAGTVAAELAVRGFTGMERLDHKDGFFTTFPVEEQSKIDAVSADLGRRWYLLESALHRYPCDTLTHPAIAAALFARELLDDPSGVEEIRVIANPLVAEFAGEVEPECRLKAARSTAHAVAVALLDGEAGLHQFAPTRIEAGDVVGLREKVMLVSSAACRPESCRVEIDLRDGSTLSHDATSAPLSEDELLAKVGGLLVPDFPGASDALYAAVRELYESPSAKPFVEVLAHPRMGVPT